MLLPLFYLFTLVSLTEGQVVCSGVNCSSGMDCISVNGVLQCADPCDQYSVLNDTWRSVDNINNPLHCDRNINWAGWYRFFLGQADAHIPEACVAVQSCGTSAPMWITEPNPTQNNLIVTRTVCNTWSGSCCYFSSNTIQVKFCSGYYVYKITIPTQCDLAYCAEPTLPTPVGFQVSGQTPNSISLQWNNVNNNNISYVLQINGSETNISAPAGDGLVNYTASSLSPDTTYTFTLYFVSGIIRGAAVSITATTAKTRTYIMVLNVKFKLADHLSQSQMEDVLSKVFRQQGLPPQISLKVRSVKPGTQ